MTILAGEEVSEGGTFRCEQCHREVQVGKAQSVPKCPRCGHDIFNDGGVEDTIH
jgi:DNA-directed RNA polymerase subunit RPC12/RpoP